jgi:hypothetical protein
MPTQPFVPTPASAWARVASAEEAKRYETEATIARPMAALDYDRAQDERWAKLAPDLIVALERLLGPPQSRLEPPPTPVLDTECDIDYESFADFHGFW